MLYEQVLSKRGEHLMLNDVYRCKKWVDNSTTKVVLTWYWDQQLESSPRLHTAACTSIAPVTRRGASH